MSIKKSGMTLSGFQFNWRPAYNLLLLILSAGLFTACPRQEQQAYAFFVAGHTYGVKEKAVPGLHMPFVQDFDFINAYPDLAFGVFTGDIVYYSRDSSWNHVDRQVSELAVPVYFTTGNHDEGHKSPYKDRYGKTFYAFEQGQDLCIVLNPGLGGWNIWRDQMEFLQAQLERARKHQHVFIFFHHLLWWNPTNEYRNFPPNSLDGRAPDINFWPEVMPLLKACQRPVYLFAGDVGAAGKPTVFFADRQDNVHFIASGMGNGRKDNYLFVEVSPEKGVEVKVKWLQTESIHTVFPAQGELPFTMRLFP